MIRSGRPIGLVVNPRGAFGARAILAIIAAIATVGCGATPQVATAPPSNGQLGASERPSTPGDPTPGVPPSDVPGDPTDGPIGTPGPGVLTPLPQPSISEPAEIARALLEPGRVSDGVVSLLAAMGVAIDDRAGALLREGADRGAGELWLTEDDVRTLIAMTEDDIAQIDEHGGPFPLAQLHAALAPALPPGYSIDELAAAYSAAYTDEPDALAAQVMRGQAIDRAAGLLTVQMWLLLVDGFIGPSEGTAARSGGDAPARFTVGGGVGLARLPPGNTIGAARQHLPALTSPAAPLTAQEWGELLYHLPTLAADVPFESFKFGDPLHEGHGGPGEGAEWGVLVGSPNALISRQTGRVLLSPLARPGVQVTWRSDEESVWNAHGAFDRPLGQPIATQAVAPAHAALIGFDPKEEDGNGTGTVLREWADVRATADALDLVRHAFDIGGLPPQVLGLIRGRQTAFHTGPHPIAWHQQGDGWFVTITWTDIFDGIPDTISFRGVIDTKTGVLGQPNYFVGTGQAVGSRPGWKSCNPGIDVVPSGSGPAEFQGGIEGDNLVIAAWPTINHPLAGILAGPFVVPLETGFAQQLPTSVNVHADPLCPHSQAWFVQVQQFGDP